MKEMRRSSSSLPIAMEQGVVIVFTHPSKRSGSFLSAVEATYLAAWKKNKKYADLAAQGRMNRYRKMESTEISILHIRSGLLLQDRLPLWQEERQLTPVVFNSPFFALNLPFFVLLFCCSKADPAQQQSVSGRWLLLLMDSCPYLQNQHCRWNSENSNVLCLWSLNAGPVVEVLWKEVCILWSVKPTIDSLQQKQKYQQWTPKGVLSLPPKRNKWWL